MRGRNGGSDRDRDMWRERERDSCADADKVLNSRRGFNASLVVESIRSVVLLSGCRERSSPN